MNLQDNPFEKNAEEYDRWYNKNAEVLEIELSAVKFLLDKAKNESQVRSGKRELHGLEVGVGSGRFSAALGIGNGIDPAPAMLALAAKRGIRVFCGTAENLPFSDSQFDYTAFFTSICFLEDPLQSFIEANRVTKADGFLICSFLNRESPMGKQLDEHKMEDKYYSGARFFSGSEVMDLLEKTGYRPCCTREAVFSGAEENMQHKEGLGEGLYGIILAWKK
jgi:SAM-dependent methyltransferase